MLCAHLTRVDPDIVHVIYPHLIAEPASGFRRGNGLCVRAWTLPKETIMSCGSAAGVVRLMVYDVADIMSMPLTGREL
jgi:hypothetical protein